MKQVLLCTRYEYRKLMLFQKGLLILLIGCCLNGLLWGRTQPNFYTCTFDPALYKSYTAEFGGAYSEDTLTAIRQELSRQRTIAAATFETEELSSDEYLQQVNQIAIAQKKAEVLKAIESRYEALGELQAFRPLLTYDLELTAFCSQFQQDWVTLLCISIFTCIILFADRRCGMEPLLYATATGKPRILQGKLLTLCSLALGTACFFWLCRTGILWNRWDLGDLHAPIQSFSGFEACTLTLSGWGMLGLCGVIQTLSSLLLALLLALLLSILKNEVLGISVLAVLIGGGVFIDSPGSRIFANPAAYLAGTPVIAQMSPVSCTLVLCAQGLLFAVLALGVYRIRIRQS